MKRISTWALIIMIHSGVGSLAMSSDDFNKEIDMLTQDQYQEHLITMNQTGVTEAAVDFENTYRKPATTKSLTFFPLRLRSKAYPRPKVKFANSDVPPKTLPPKPKVNLIELYREQVL